MNKTEFGKKLKSVHNFQKKLEKGIPHTQMIGGKKINFLVMDVWIDIENGDYQFNADDCSYIPKCELGKWLYNNIDTEWHYSHVEGYDVECSAMQYLEKDIQNLKNQIPKEERKQFDDYYWTSRNHRGLRFVDIFTKAYEMYEQAFKKELFDKKKEKDYVMFDGKWVKKDVLREIVAKFDA